MFSHLNPQSSDFGDICALYSPFLHQISVQCSLFEPGRQWPCPGYSRRRDRINLGLLRSYDKGGGGATFSTRPFRLYHRRYSMNDAEPLTSTRSFNGQSIRNHFLRHPKCDLGQQRGGRPSTPDHSSQEVQNFAPLQVLTGHTKGVLTVAVDNCNNTLFTGSLDGTIRVWGLVTCQPMGVLRARTAVLCLEVQRPPLQSPPSGAGSQFSRNFPQLDSTPPDHNPPPCSFTHTP